MRRGAELAAVTAGGLTLGASAFFYVLTNDFFGHLAQGREIAELGRVPTTDARSVLWDEPRPWSNYEWLFDLGLWRLFDAGGVAGVIALKVAVMFGAGAIVVWLASSLGRAALKSDGGGKTVAWLAVVSLLVVAPMLKGRMTARPQVLGFIFVGVLLLGIWGTMRDRERCWKWVVPLVLLHVLWVNTHGSHLLGLGIAGLFAAVAMRSAAFRPLAALFVGQLVVSGATPFGYAILTDAVEHIVRPEYRALVEDWMPWQPKHPLTWLVLSMVYAVGSLASLRALRPLGRFGTGYALLSVVLTLMAFRSVRFMSYLVLFATPIVALGMAAVLERIAARADAPEQTVSRRRSLFVGVGLVAAGLWCLSASASHPPAVPYGVGVFERGQAWSSLRYLKREGRNARVFNDLEQGWNLMYAVPNAKITVDPRAPFYGPRAIAHVHNITVDPPRLQPFLREHRIDRALLRHAAPPGPRAAASLAASGAWSLVHVEDAHALFALAGTETTQGFSHLPHGYLPGALFDTNVRVGAVEDELMRLGTDTNGSAYRNWVRGVLALRSVLLPGGDRGLPSSPTPAQRASARLAADHLAKTSHTFAGLPYVETYIALAFAASCDLAAARAALSRVASPNRESTLARHEIDLRDPEAAVRQRAKAAIRSYAAIPALAGVPWVRALSERLPHVSTCSDGDS